MAEEIVFNVIDIFAEDYVDEAALDEDGEENACPAYLIKLFGRMEDGRTVSVNVQDYTPHFYLRLPRVLQPVQVKQFESHMRALYKGGFRGAKQMMKKDFWGFTNDQKYPFMQLLFKNHATMKRAGFAFANKAVAIGSVFPTPHKFKVYESNIEPFLRMFHRRDVAPCGWVSVSKYSKNLSIHQSTCDVDINAKWTTISPVQRDSIAPLKIASFDIECVSFDGQFPLAKRDYRKIALTFLEEHGAHVDTDSIGSRFVAYFKEMISGGKLVPKKDGLADVSWLLGAHRSEVVDILRGVVAFEGGKAVRLERPRTLEDDEELVVKSFERKLQAIFPRLEGDPIIQVGTTVHTYGEKEASERHIFVVGSCDPIQGATVYTFDTERELLVAWTRFIRDAVDPDVMLGYNIFGFDFEYMYQRSEELDCKNEFNTLGRIKGRVSQRKEKNLSSSALGDNHLTYLEIEGRVVIDIMKVVQRDHKLDSYKLDNVAFHFTGDRKNDVSPQDIFRLHRGTSADRKTVAEYCIKDCALLNKLCAKLEIVANNVGMANVCCVPLNWIFMRGQGVKIFSLVAKRCKEDEYMVPVVKAAYGSVDAGEEVYEGAIVLSPQPGIHMDPITVLDYASLYPSSMISENISHDTLVIDLKYDNLPGVDYVDVVYDEYSGAGDKKVKCGERRCRFAQNRQGVLPRILQHLLAQRKATRKKMEYQTLAISTADGTAFNVTGLVLSDDGGTIKLRKEDGNVIDVKREDVVAQHDTFDDFQKAVLDGLQLAYKVTANSMYGQVGARTSPIYLKDLAASTTATGRNMIVNAKKFIEEEFNGKVIYGDSVAGYTPVLVRVQRRGVWHVMYVPIEDLSGRYGRTWRRCEGSGREGKMSSELCLDVEAWTDAGWTRVKRVIKHKLAPHKRMLRVVTKSGVVDVTDDHSLLRPSGETVSPKDIAIGQGLLHADLPPWSESNASVSRVVGPWWREVATGPPQIDEYQPTEDEWRVMGMFFACGKCSIQRGDAVSEDVAKWSLRAASPSVLEPYKAICEQTYSGLGWMVMRASQGSYALVLNPADYCQAMRFVYMYMGIMYHGGRLPAVPQSLMGAPAWARKAFLRGVCDGTGGTRMDVATQMSAANVFALVSSLALAPRIEVLDHRFRVSWGAASLDNPDSGSDGITDITDITQLWRDGHSDGGYDDDGYERDDDDDAYVYDLTTDNNHFAAGVGRIVVHNTDSIFIHVPSPKNGMTQEEVVGRAIQYGITAQKAFRPHLKPPHDCEWEKLFYPFIIFSKKRYIGNVYDNPDKPNKCKLKCMGVVLKRRDNAPIVKTIYGGCIDIILNKHDIPAAVDFLKEGLQKLIRGEFPLEELVITKSLRANYKDPQRIAHKVLAERMAERDPGNKPQTSDRIPYVYVEQPPTSSADTTKAAKILQGDRIETPDFIKKNGLRPDYKFYISNQIMKPVVQIFGLIVEQLPGYDRPSDYWERVRAKLELDDGLKGDKLDEKVITLREDDAQRLLFEPVLMQLGDKAKRRKDWLAPPKAAAAPPSKRASKATEAQEPPKRRATKAKAPPPPSSS